MMRVHYFMIHHKLINHNCILIYIETNVYPTFHTRYIISYPTIFILLANDTDVHDHPHIWNNVYL